MEEAFVAEPVDDAWQVEQPLDQKLQALVGAGGRVVDVECRSTMCRVETEHADAATYARFTQAFDLLPAGRSVPEAAWEGSSRFISVELPVEDSDDLPRTLSIAYLARPGSDLPDPAPYPQDAVAASELAQGKVEHGGSVRE